jgi:hypothetical protein
MTLNRILFFTRLHEVASSTLSHHNFAIDNHLLLCVQIRRTQSVIDSREIHRRITLLKINLLHIILRLILLSLAAIGGFKVYLLALRHRGVQLRL